jgi:uracil-DNA glycosylase
MADQSEKHTEDLEPPSSQASVVSKDEKVSIAASSDPGPDRDESTKPKLAPSTSTANGKRQRTLFDMLGSAPSQGSNTPSKKPKLTASGSSGNDKVSAAVSSSGGSSGLQTLNSIPFSSSEYVDSLTGDQKRLLNLECVTMGKSWLKVLKDEIRKPYFISLKEFLWKEGVQGDDSAPNLQVYPPRKIYS